MGTRRVEELAGIFAVARRAVKPRCRGAAVTLAFMLLFATVTPGYAYRPFDSTDAALAGRGEIEIELGPFGYLVADRERFWVVPATILNIGVTNRWEVVLEGRGFVRLSDPTGAERVSLEDTALSLKHLLRQGSLQEGRGLSFASEVGLLLPNINGERGVGLKAAAIASERWSSVTVHLNAGVEIARDHALGAFGGVIVEGPHRWAVRPAAELTFEQGSTQNVSGLVGAIWQVRDNLSLDGAWRMGRTDHAPAREARLGMTIGLSP